MKKFTFILLLSSLLLHLSLAAQKKVTLSGYIKDVSNGEAAIGATIYVPEAETGVNTNIYGFYSISLEPGEYTFVFSYVGFSTVTKKINLTSNTTVGIELEPADIQLKEVVVQGEKKDQNVTSVEMSVEKMDVKTVQKMPAFFGEPDIIQSTLLLPGVTNVGEGASGFNVRGGNVDQNLILLDGAPIYNSSHLFGFFSIFNSDAIQDFRLYKGGIPAEYGGRLSSVMDIHQKEGNSKEFQGTAGISSIATKATIEGPIIKNKWSFVASGRVSYLGYLTKFSPETADNNIYFYDINGKTNYIIDEKNRVFLSGYYGKDVLIFGDDFRMDWGNGTVTARWNHLFNSKIFSNLSYIYSNFDYNLGSEDDNFSFNWNAKIINNNVKYDFTYYANTSNTVRFGISGLIYDFRPGEVTTGPNSGFNNLKVPHENALECAAYASNEQKVSQRITLQYGLRYSWFMNYGEADINEYETGRPRDSEDPNSVNGENEIIGKIHYDPWETIATYDGLEPRISAVYLLDDRSSLKASYNRTKQYIHLVSNTTASVPIDVWKPAGKYVRPATADQVAMGYFINLADNKYEISAEVYYKTFEDLLDYVDGAELILNPNVESELLQGRGEAYGLELQLKKTAGKTTGWVNYTLSRTFRQVKGINGSDPYPANYDKPHDVSLVVMHQMTKKIDFSFTFNYMTGRPITYPDGRYEIEGYVLPNYSNRNGARMPDFHRLDFSLNYVPMRKPDAKIKGRWNLSVFNVYARRNAFSISFRQSEENPYKTEAYRISVLGTVVPAIGYSITF